MNAIKLKNAISSYKASSHVSNYGRDANVTANDLNRAIDNTAKLFEIFLKEIKSLDEGR